MKRQPYYSPEELALEVGQSVNAILGMIVDKNLMAVRVGSSYRIPLGAALRALEPTEIGDGVVSMRKQDGSEETIEAEPGHFLRTVVNDKTGNVEIEQVRYFTIAEAMAEMTSEEIATMDEVRDAINAAS